MSIPTLPPLALAETLLSEREHRAGLGPPFAAGRLAAYASLARRAMRFGAGSPGHQRECRNIRTTLAPTARFGIATAAASSPGRAAQVVAAIQFHYHGLIPTGPAGTVLLSVTSHSNSELKMDEQVSIMESVQDTLEKNVEIIFGHG